MINIIEDRTLALFTRLLDFPSPPGEEHRIADEVEKQIEQIGFDSERDGAGNITVAVDGKDNSLGRMILAAHMDEIAMVIRGIEENGDLRATRLGGLYPAKLGEGPVDVLGSAEIVKGVLSFGSMHRPDAGQHAFSWESARIITGFSPRELAERGVQIGTAAVPSREVRGPVFVGPESNPLVASWTFSKNGQADCAEFIADRKIPVERLFTDRWKLEQAEEAYKLFDTQTTGKGVFLM